MMWHYFGIFQRATVLTPLWRRGPSSARLYSTSNTTPWQVFEVCHLFYIYNKSDLVGTLTKVPLPDAFWCDAFFIKRKRVFFFFSYLHVNLCCFVIDRKLTQGYSKYRKHHMVWHDYLSCHTIWLSHYMIWIVISCR